MLAMAPQDPSPPSPRHRTQRALSMAAATRKTRDALRNHALDYNDHHPLPAIPYPDLPALPDSKEEARRSSRQRRDLILKTFQHSHGLSLNEDKEKDKEKEKARQAKLERKQKKADYKNMYQSQAEYQQSTSRSSSFSKTDKPQQRSLPIYPSSPETWQPPASELYYHNTRHHRREHPLDQQPPPLSPRPQHHHLHHYQNQSQIHLNSFSSTNSSITNATTLYNFSTHVPSSTSDKSRSLSLKSNTKSMYDLRPWSGSPRSPVYDHPANYDSDDTAASHNWDSLMDTLHSPTFPPNSEDWGSKEEVEVDPAMDSLSSLSLNHQSNGNGRYMLVLGANGRTGIELVRQGLERNYRVTAFVRDDKVLLEDTLLRKNQNLLIVRGSPTCQADVDRVVEGQDVVVNVIGARLMTGDTTISSHSQVVLNNALKNHGIRRLVVVTSYGCLGLRNYLISTRRLFSRMFMTGILKDKVLQEDIIQRDSAHLDWTIIRPITLKDGDLSGKYLLSSDILPKTDRVKVLSRKDLAHYILSILNRPEEYGAIRSIGGKPKHRVSLAKQYCPFEKKRLAAEQAKAEEELARAIEARAAEAI